MDNIIESLSATSFFSHFNQGDINALKQYVTLRDYKKNDVLIHQDENAQDLYFIVSGEVVIYQSNLNTTEQPIISTIGKNALLGELSFLSGKPRSSSAKCNTDVTVMVIPRSIKEDCYELYQHICHGISQIIESRLRMTSSDLSASLLKTIELLKSYMTLYNMFIVLLAVVTISIITNRVLREILTDVDLYSPKFSWTYLLLLSVPLCIAQYKMRYPFSKLGFAPLSLKSKLLLLFIIAILSFPMIAFSFFVKGNSMHEILHMIYISFFKLSSFSYLWLCVAQEYVRCLFQTILNDLPNKNYPIQPILFSSLIFSLIHVHLGLAAVGATFLAGILFAIYYQMNKNFVAVSFLHWFPGHLAFALNFL